LRSKTSWGKLGVRQTATGCRRNRDLFHSLTRRGRHTRDTRCRLVIHESPNHKTSPEYLRKLRRHHFGLTRAHSFEPTGVEHAASEEGWGGGVWWCASLSLWVGGWGGGGFFFVGAGGVGDRRQGRRHYEPCWWPTTATTGPALDNARPWCDTFAGGEQCMPTTRGQFDLRRHNEWSSGHGANRRGHRPWSSSYVATNVTGGAKKAPGSCQVLFGSRSTNSPKQPARPFAIARGLIPARSKTRTGPPSRLTAAKPITSRRVAPNRVRGAILTG